MSSPELNFVMADPNGAVDRIEALEEALEKIKHLVLTNRTHSVLDEVQGVCDSVLVDVGTSS